MSAEQFWPGVVARPQLAALPNVVEGRLAFAEEMVADELRGERVSRVGGTGLTFSHFGRLLREGVSHHFRW